MAAPKTAAVRYAPEDPTLPKPWKGLIDGETGYIYFWNPETNVTQYQKPSTSQIKPDSRDKYVSVAISTPVQAQQSSQVPNQEINTTDDDSHRNGRGSDGRPKVDSGGKSDQNHKNVTGWMFTEGTAVEVSFQKENFDIWHIGTVTEAAENSKCFVKYQCPGVKGHKIQEFVHSPDIRPSPPSLEYNDYNLLEKVEAYFECCWWSGIIKRLLEDRSYIVYVKHAKKEMTFDHAHLRPPMVWTDGKWISEAKDNGRPGVRTWQSENLNRQHRTAEERQTANGGVSTENGNAGIHVDEIVDKECLTKEVNMSVEEVKGARSAENCDVPQEKDQEKQIRDQQIHSVDTIKGSTQGTNSSKRKRGRPKMLSKKRPGERSAGPKLDTKDSCVGEEAEVNAESNCVMSTTVDEIPNIEVSHTLSKENMEANTSNRKLRSGVCSINGVVSRTENIPLLDNQAGEAVSSKRGSRLKNSVSNGQGEVGRTVDSEPQHQESNEIDIGKDDNMMIDAVGGIKDDQPLSMWLKGPPPVGSDDSRALPVQDQCANANSRIDGFETPPLAKVNTVNPSPPQKTDGPGLNGYADTMENESLPFVKSSPLWETIDSMELYKTQKPHFSPLVKSVAETREGLAIGMMVNFSNLVKNTSKLQFSCDIAVIERSLKTLADFETHGFDVAKVRACLTQLLSMKQRGTELQKEYEDIQSEIDDSLDEGKLDEEINQLYQKYKEIEKKLAEARLEKEMRDKKITAMQSKRDVVQSIEAEFESIVGCLNLE